MPIVEFETAGRQHPAGQGARRPATDGLVTRGLGESAVVERAQRTFETALRPIRTVSEGVLAELRAIPRHPDAVTVEFGLEFTANSSAVLVGRHGGRERPGADVVEGAERPGRDRGPGG